MEIVVAFMEFRDIGTETKTQNCPQFAEHNGTETQLGKTQKRTMTW